MENGYAIIKTLIDWVHQYTEDTKNPDFTLEEFLIWLNSMVFSGKDIHNPTKNSDQVNMELSFLLIMQNRHYKSYTKKALHESVLSSPDSFSFLYHLSLVDSFRKMELVKMHLMEAPSGIEVLKRLLEKGLIEEFADPDDKRAKRIKITPQGSKELEKCLPAMREVFHQMSADLNLRDKLHLISALKKMNDFHAS